MWFPRSSLIVLVAFFLSHSGAEWNTNDFLKREHSLVKPYQGSGFGIPNWDFFGATMVTGTHIRLTPNQQGKTGAIWNKIPVRVRNWELQVQFRVSGTTKDLFGDGFAIWYARDRMEPGPVFGSRDYYSGLAITVDTYSNHNGPHNHNHPYMAAMVNNGTIHYDHDRDGTHALIGGCEVKFRNFEHDTWIAIRYENDVLTVSHDLDNKRAWIQCLRVEGVHLPTGYYFGASAATGDLSDNHDILAMKLYELDLPENAQNEAVDRSKINPSSQYFEPPRDHVEDPKPSSMSGLKMFFLLLFGVLGCIACVIIGVMIYQKQQDNSRKRFY